MNGYRYQNPLQTIVGKGLNITLRLWQGKDWEWTSKDYEHIDFQEEIDAGEWVVEEEDTSVVDSYHMVAFPDSPSHSKKKHEKGKRQAETHTQLSRTFNADEKKFFDGVEMNLTGLSFHSATFAVTDVPPHHVSRFCLQIEDIDILDRVSGSVWNKMMTSLKPSMYGAPRETASTMFHGELVGLLPDPKEPDRIEHRFEVRDRTWLCNCLELSVILENVDGAIAFAYVH